MASSSPALAMDAPWRAFAACRTADPDLFFPSGSRRSSSEKARAICAVCPARGACLDMALADPSLTGVWGGTTAADRRRIRKKVRRAAVAERVISAA